MTHTHPIHEIATLTSKGQITLPKMIRQVLGLDVGGKIAFDVREGEIVLSRVDQHEPRDPAISAFLALLEKDIRSGKHIQFLPDDLAHAMLANSGAVNLDDAIDGDVAL
jgi:antitoxin PrlF